MRIQVYTLDDNDITWSKNGDLGWEDGSWSLLNIDSDRSIKRLTLFLDEKSNKIGDNKWLLSLSNVLYVPFVRFGDEIVVEKPENKEKKGENQSIQDENTSETDE
jgi:hypothetical protein